MNSNKSTELLTSMESRLDDMLTNIEIIKTVRSNVLSRKNIAASNDILKKKKRIKNVKVSANEMKKADRKE